MLLFSFSPEVTGKQILHKSLHSGQNILKTVFFTKRTAHQGFNLYAFLEMANEINFWIVLIILHYIGSSVFI